MNDRSKKRPRTSDRKVVCDDNNLRYVEFYSGIGGWTMALEDALQRLAGTDAFANIRGQRVAALDHSDLCTRVFEHNFGTDRKSFQIERLTREQTEEWDARIWLMSPPCRKYEICVLDSTTCWIPSVESMVPNGYVLFR
eukprot:scaffold3827_cov179-Cylindrotheca_fusiformis.AAC.48